MKWRVLALQTYSAAMNMAIDESVSETVRVGGPPTVRFYQWEPPAVSIGYFQSLQQEVNREACAKAGVDIVRRRTGGGAVYHDKELTYSVIGKEELFPRGITESYHEICGWVIDGLQKIGLDGEFHPINDVLVGEKKISGNAQTRRGGVLLQHGTILYDLDVERMFSLLKVDNVKLKDKLIKNVKERVTSVKSVSSAGKEELCRAMVSAFTQGKDWEWGVLSSEELARAQELKERYQDTAWLEQR